MTGRELMKLLLDLPAEALDYRIEFWPPKGPVLDINTTGLSNNQAIVLTNGDGGTT
jgi:hypothetical protein